MDVEQKALPAWRNRKGSGGSSVGAKNVVSEPSLRRWGDIEVNLTMLTCYQYHQTFAEPFHPRRSEQGGKTDTSSHRTVSAPKAVCFLTVLLEF